MSAEVLFTALEEAVAEVGQDTSATRMEKLLAAVADLKAFILDEKKGHALKNVKQYANTYNYV